MCSSGRRTQAAALALLAVVAGGGCGRNTACEVLPRGPLKELRLHGREIPAGYELLRNPAVLKSLQLSANPDYVQRPSDLELVASAGGLASFLAVYGRSNDVRLVINGVYFRDSGRLDAFVKMQQTKRRAMLAYRRATTDGFWLLLAARNPGGAYDADELALLRRSLQRYARRLGLETVFDTLEGGDGS